MVKAQSSSEDYNVQGTGKCIYYLYETPPAPWHNPVISPPI